MKSFYVRKNGHEAGPFNLKMAMFVAEAGSGEIFFLELDPAGEEMIKQPWKSEPISLGITEEDIDIISSRLTVLEEIAYAHADSADYAHMQWHMRRPKRSPISKTLLVAPASLGALPYSEHSFILRCLANTF